MSDKGQEVVPALTGFDPARITPPNVWGGSGFEVHNAYDEEEGRVEMGAVPRWHVMVNGVGSWPVAYFYEQADAELWSHTMNAHFAAIAMEAATAGETCNRLDPKDDSAGRRHRTETGGQ